MGCCQRGNAVQWPAIFTTVRIVQQLIIFGVTETGQRFRPSDWAERLAGVMSQFRPPGTRKDRLSYSPYVYPTYIDGVRCVVVDHRLRALEPLAWAFVVDFAKSNQLKTQERQGPPQRPD
ncbi:MAG: DUF3579 domain-containing protein [Pusillimonas sp.]